MTHKIFRKLLAMSFLALIITVFIIPGNSKTSDVFYLSNFTEASSDIYGEDFTTTIFRDSPSTNTFGWGRGYISSPRNYTFNPLHSYSTPGPVIDLEIQGHRCFALTHDPTVSAAQMHIFDISDPTSIGILGTTSWGNNGTALAVDGAYYYIGMDYIGGPSFITNDAIDPTNPIGHYAFTVSTKITDIETEGRYVYFVNYNDIGGKSLKVFDAMDPTTSSWYSTTDWLNSNGLGLTVEGFYAFIAASDDGLYILNISNVLSPTFVGHVDTPGNATDVIVDGAFAYVTDGDAGIHVVSIADPTNPEIISTFDSGGITRKLVKQGNTLIVTDGADGFAILDVADPFNPVHVINILPDYTYDVALYGGIIVVATATGIHTFSLASSLTGITGYEQTNFISAYSDYQVWDVKVQGNIAYVAGGPDGFYTLDVRFPENPLLLDRWIPPGGEVIKKLDIEGQYAYLIDNSNFIVIDISDPYNLNYLTRLATSPGLTDVYSEGHTLYWSWGGGTMPVFNITTPGTINWGEMIDEVFHGNNISSVWAQGRHAYTVNYAGGAFVPAIFTHSAFDLTSVTITDSDTGPAWMTDIHVDGEIAYAADRVTCVLFDINDPTNIIFTDEYLTPDVQGVWSFGQYAMLADRIVGLILLDTTNIYSIFKIADVPELFGGMQLVTHGDYTYYTNQSSLSILRHFESAGDTYVDGVAIAQSLEVDSMAFGEIKSATLTPADYIPQGTHVDYYMSADGGTHWEAVTPGVEHAFINTGDDLRWRAEVFGPTHRSAHIYHIEIAYEFNEAPSQPTITDLGEKTFGIFKVDWSDSTDDVTVDHYILQMSDTLSFVTIQKEWTTTESNKLVMIGKGTFYFRVQAVDDEDYPSPWSLVKSATIKISTTILGIIIGGGAVVLILAILIPLILVKRRKKIPTR